MFNKLQLNNWQLTEFSFLCFKSLANFKDKIAPKKILTSNISLNSYSHVDKTITQLVSQRGLETLFPELDIFF